MKPHRLKRWRLKYNFCRGCGKPFMITGYQYIWCKEC